MGIVCWQTRCPHSARCTRRSKPCGLGTSASLTPRRRLQAERGSETGSGFQQSKHRTVNVLGREPVRSPRSVDCYAGACKPSFLAMHCLSRLCAVLTAESLIMLHAKSCCGAVLGRRLR